MSTALALGAVAVATAAASMVAVTAPAEAASGNKASAPGITANQVTVGFVTSLTGPAAADFVGNQQGAQARIDLQNAEGGVDGRKIKMVTGDDESSITGGETAVSELIQSRGAFGLMFASDFVAAGYRIAQKDGIPVVGWPVDGPEWGEQPNTNMVSVEGNVSPNPVANTLDVKVAKLAGAKNMAAFAIADEQPSVVGAQAFVTAAKAGGLKVGYENYSIPIGTVDVNTIVLAMKQAHIDGFVSEMLDTTDFAIDEGAREAGVKLVAPISVTGYGQQLLSQPSALASAQGAIFAVTQTPVENHTKATEQEQAAFKKYEHFSGVPSLSWTAGWTSADLFIKGLEAAGRNPTRSSYLTAIRKEKNWDAGGLFPSARDLSLKTFGTAPSTQCSYFVRLEGKKFVPMNGGKPICGTNVK